MMEIRASTQLLLQEAGYSVSIWRDEIGPVTRFEDPSVMGFVFEFDTVATLLATYSSREQNVLSAHAPVFRIAGQKAWNVYSVFLTGDDANGLLSRQVSQIDEDLRMTRKIARIGIKSDASLRSALLPLLPIESRPQVDRDDFITRVSSAVSHIAPATIVDAFLGPSTPAELVRMMVNES